MSGGEGKARPSACGVLDLLDIVAGHVIEARTAVVAMAPEDRGSLLSFTDCLLAEVGRRIAANLPKPIGEHDAEGA